MGASCSGGRDLNLGDVLGGGLLSMYGYDCVNESPQNCLVDITWGIEIGNNGRGPENITSVEIQIGVGKVKKNKPGKIVETVNFGPPDIPRILAFGRSFVVKHPSQADFCSPEVRYFGTFEAVAATPNSGVPCLRKDTYKFNTDMSTFSPSRSPTRAPTVCPTSSPTTSPTGVPTGTPTASPTGVPTDTPT